MYFFRRSNMGILEVILLVGAAMIVLAIVIGFCCHCLHPQGKVKNDKLAQRKTPFNVADVPAAPRPYHPDIEAGWDDTPLKPLPRRAQLNEAAKFKHIGPTCKSKEDAERKSVERNSKYPQDVGEINTVFQVAPKDMSSIEH